MARKSIYLPEKGGVSCYTHADTNLFSWKQLLSLENAFVVFESSGWYLNTNFHCFYWRVNTIRYLTWKESMDCQVFSSPYFRQAISSERERTRKDGRVSTIDHRKIQQELLGSSQYCVWCELSSAEGLTGTPGAEQLREHGAPKGLFSMN